MQPFKSQSAEFRNNSYNNWLLRIVVDIDEIRENALHRGNDVDGLHAHTHTHSGVNIRKWPSQRTILTGGLHKSAFNSNAEMHSCQAVIFAPHSQAFTHLDILVPEDLSGFEHERHLVTHPHTQAGDGSSLARRQRRDEADGAFLQHTQGYRHYHVPAHAWDDLFAVKSERSGISGVASLCSTKRLKGVVVIGLAHAPQ